MATPCSMFCSVACSADSRASAVALCRSRLLGFSQALLLQAQLCDVDMGIQMDGIHPGQTCTRGA